MQEKITPEAVLEEIPIWFVVQGQVRNAGGESLVGITVRAYDKQFRSEELLGEAITGKEGYYSISYKQETGEERKNINLAVKVINFDGKELATSPICFNAQQSETIDLTISGDYCIPSEYEQLVQAVTPLLGDVPTDQLREDGEHQDITYLAGKTGYDQKRLRQLVQSAKIAKETGLQAEVVYGLFQQNGTNDLTGLLNQHPDILYQALKDVVSKNIIPALPAKSIQKATRKLDQLIFENAFNKPKEKGRALIGSLVATVLPTARKQKTFVSMYARHQGSLKDFLEEGGWKDDSDLKDHTEDLHFTLQVGELTQQNLPLVQKLQQKRLSGDIKSLRDLASYDERKWKELIGKDIEKPGEEAKRIARGIEEQFPTEVIAHRIVKGGSAHPEEVRTFFDNYLNKELSFNIKTTLIHKFLTDNPNALDSIPKDRHKPLVAALKSQQRVRKLTDNADQMQALMADGIHSAAQIARMGRSAFIETYSGVLGGDEEAAAKIHGRAQLATAAALNLIAEYHPGFNQIGMAVLKSNSDAVKKVTIPDWETLFGTFDLCDCPDCRSVLGPAAYLTDILHFLNDCKNSQVKTPLEVLLTRRPDLAETELTCENTNTTLPYIDLVNEVLEDAISPRRFTIEDYSSTLYAARISAELRYLFEANGYPLREDAEIHVVTTGRWRIRNKGWNFELNMYTSQQGSKLIEVKPWPQTGGTSEELAVTPEHINAGVYDDYIKSAVYPWSLPFNLWVEWVRAYLGQLGVQRHELIQAFYPDQLPGGSNAISAAADYLGMSMQEWNAITRSGMPALGDWEYWGSTRSGWQQDITDVTRGLTCVRNLLERSGLTYNELDQLLRLRFVNPLGDLCIKANTGEAFDTCDTTKLVLQGLDDKALMRIHDFVCLWRRLGWTMTEVDQALCALLGITLEQQSLGNLQEVSGNLTIILQAISAQIANVSTASKNLQKDINVIRSIPLAAEGGQSLRQSGLVLLQAIKALLGKKLDVVTGLAGVTGALEKALHKLMTTKLNSREHGDYDGACRAFVIAAKALLGSLSDLPDVVKKLDELIDLLENHAPADFTMNSLLNMLNHIRVVHYALEEVPEDRALLSGCKGALESLAKAIVDIPAKVGIPLNAFMLLIQLQASLDRFMATELDNRLAAEALQNFVESALAISTPAKPKGSVLNKNFSLFCKSFNSFNKSLTELLMANGLQYQCVPELLSLETGLAPYEDDSPLTNGTLIDMAYSAADRQWLHSELAGMISQECDVLSRALDTFSREVDRLPVTYIFDQDVTILDRDVVVALADMENAMARLTGDYVQVSVLLELTNACRNFYREADANQVALKGQFTEVMQRARGIIDLACQNLHSVGVEEYFLKQVYGFKQFIDDLINEIPSPAKGSAINQRRLQNHYFQSDIENVLKFPGFKEPIFKEPIHNVSKAKSGIALEALIRCLQEARKVLGSADSLSNPRPSYVNTAVNSINALSGKLTRDIAGIKIDDTVMQELSDVHRFHTDFNLPIEAVVSWYGPLDTYQYRNGEGEYLASFYSRLFQNPSFMKVRPHDIDPFAFDPACNELSGCAKRLDSDTARSRVMAALGITDAELGLLLNGQTVRLETKVCQAIAPSIGSRKKLTLGNLTMLYRYVSLAQALGLSVGELLQIINLTEEKPFGVSTGKTPRTYKTSSFIILTNKIRNSGFTINELNYLLRNLDSTIEPVCPREEDMARVLGEIREGLQKIADETALKPDPTGDATRKSLALLADKETVDRVMQILQCDDQRFEDELMKLDRSTYEAIAGPLPDNFGDTLGALAVLKGKAAYHNESQLLRFSGVMGADERSALLGLLPDTDYAQYHQAVNSLFDMPRVYIAENAKDLKLPTFEAFLWQLPQPFTLPDGLKCKVYADLGNYRLRFAGIMSDEERQTLENSFPSLKDAIGSLYDFPRGYLQWVLKCFEPPLVKAELTFSPDDTGIVFPAELKKKVYYDSANKKLCFIGRMTGAEYNKLFKLADDRENENPNDAELKARTLAFKEALDLLNIAYSNCIIDPENIFIGEAETRRLFGGPDNVRLDAGGRLSFLLGKCLEHQRTVSNRNLVTQKLAESLGLETGVMAQLLTRWVTPPDRKAGNILDIFLMPEFAASDPRVKLTLKLFKSQFTTFLLLHKISMFISRFGVSREQLVWLFEYAPEQEVGWLKPDQVTVEPGLILGGGVLFPQWLRLADLFVLRDGLQNGSLVLSEIFSLARQDETTESQLLQNLSDRTGWSMADLHLLAGKDCFDLDPGTAYGNEKGILRLKRCFDLIKRSRVSAIQCLAWAKADLKESPVTARDALSAKQAVKTRYSGAEWREVARPLADRLRERQRDALAAYLLAYPEIYFDQHPGINRPLYQWKDINELYSYFLIDVEMNSEMITSRIKQACGSVQLFIQRCLMNLESEVSIKDDKWLEWERWMKYYRVWEANRRIFLYPENWIEPELRDDKSPFFKELENELMQNEVTKDTAETALLHYLEKLDQVARLEICGMEYELEPSINRLHVFARTPNTPHVYYYRQRVDSLYWTAWEKVDLDIEGDHLLPVVWNRRLFIFWLTFKEDVKQQKKLSITSGGDVDSPPRIWKINLAWSQYKNGKWVGKKLAKNALEITEYYENQFKCTNAWRCYTCKKETNFYHCPDYRWMPHQKSISLESFIVDNNLEIGIQWPVPDDSELRCERFYCFTGCSEQPEISKQVVYNSSNLAILGVQEFQSAVGKKELYLKKNPGYFMPITVDTKVGVNPNKYTTNPLDFRPLDSPYFFCSDNIRTFFITYGQYYSNVPAQFRFNTFYHPDLPLFMSELNRSGIDGLLQREIQTHKSPFNFNIEYSASPYYVDRIKTPTEDVDFEDDGAYSQYNWELFFHAPLLIADRLSKNQRFEEAMKWFHYIFNPTDASGKGEPDQPQQHYWQTKPFFERAKDGEDGYVQEQIKNILSSLAQGTSFKLMDAVSRWRKNPFKPDVVARLRTTAYQKAVVMKYIDNLIAWGDQLFRRDTIESINEAIQLYVLAAEILGRRPEILKPRFRPVIQTYNTVRSMNLLSQGLRPDDFSDPLVEAEQIIPLVDGTVSAPTPIPINPGEMLYFGIPNNSKLLGYWDTVADRLFKIRNGLNIEGVARSLALFEPPIDPAMLVRAAAAGLDLGSVLGDLNAPVPHYRFNVMAQKAAELCAEVKALGGALLSALEKRDAEALAILRSSHEIKVLSAVREVKKRQIDETKETVEGLNKSLEVVKTRQDYYKNIPNLIPEEQAQLSLMDQGLGIQEAQAAIELIANILSLIPELKIGAPTTMGADFGGIHIGSALKSFSSYMGSMSSILNAKASMSATKGGFKRRWNDWKLQESLAEKEYRQIEKQIAAAEIRQAIAELDLSNHEQQIANAEDLDAFMHDKFTNRELYDWMLGQISSVYFQSYQLAYDIAKRAERSYQFELGLEDSSFIQFGYWDSLKKGLLAGERLHHDLKRMEMAYLDMNRREYELTKQVSLALNCPLSLLKLKETGECDISLTEDLFNMDYPGHYMRRIKSVSLTIPCVAGPYTSVNCTLTLLSNSVRVKPTLLNGKTYERIKSGDDPRFRDNLVPIQSIATSHGQNDSGMFELNFRDERYLPFEGAGAESQWRLQMPKECNAFDFNTISDIVLHVRYMAREGGDALRAAAQKRLASVIPSSGLCILSAKHEFPTEWHRFLHPASAATYQSLGIELKPEQFPFYLRGKTIEIKKMDVFVKMKNGAAPTQLNDVALILTPPGKPEQQPVALQSNPGLMNGILHANIFEGKGSLDLWTIKVNGIIGDKITYSMNPMIVDDLLIVCQYTSS